MIIVPEMVGSVVGVHNGSGFTQVEIKVCIAPSLDLEFLAGTTCQFASFGRILLRART